LGSLTSGDEGKPILVLGFNSLTANNQIGGNKESDPLFRELNKLAE